MRIDEIVVCFCLSVSDSVVHACMHVCVCVCVCVYACVCVQREEKENAPGR